MYEFKHISAANASLNQIQESRSKLIDSLLKKILYLIDDLELNPYELAEQVKKYEEEQSLLVDSVDELEELENPDELEEIDSLDKLEENDGFVEAKNSKENEKELEENKNGVKSPNEEHTEVSTSDEDELEIGPEFLLSDSLSLFIEDKTAASAIESYQKVINELKSGFNVLIDLTELDAKDIKLSHITSLIKKATALDLPLNVYIAGYSKLSKTENNVDMLFTQEDLNVLVGLNTFLLNNNEKGIKFMEDPSAPEKSWTLKEVVTANNYIDNIVRTIKLMQFTPFEAIAYIHQYITSNFGYKENDENSTSPRSIIGAINTNDIVCVGYSTLTKAIIDKLNMPGLEADVFSSVLRPEIDDKTPVRVDNLYTTYGMGHEQNIIKINDPKYQVKGVYVNDSCWDSKTEYYPDGKGFGTFMFPVSDLLNIDGQEFNECSLTDEYDLLKKVEVGDDTNPRNYPIIKKYSRRSSPIPEETYKRVIYKIYRKLYPIFSKEEIKEITDGIMRDSITSAYSVFSDKAIGSLAKAGYAGDFEKLNASEIIK